MRLVLGKFLMDEIGSIIGLIYKMQQINSLLLLQLSFCFLGFDLRLNAMPKKS